MKIKSIILASFIALLPMTPAIGAIEGFDPCDDPAAAGSTVCKNTDTGDEILGANGILRNGLQIFIYIVGFASLLMVTIGGFRYVLAGGDAQQAASARNTIIYAVVGLVIALGAQGILTFVIDRL